MTILNSVLRNRFGNYYKIKLPYEINTQLNLKSEPFWSEASTNQFVKDLSAPVGYWREIVNNACNQSSSLLTTSEIEQKVSHLILGGQIKLFPVDIPDIVEHPPENRVIKKQEANYRFASKSSLLISNPAEVKLFSTEEDAERFLYELSASEEQLQIIAKDLNVNLSSTTDISNSSIVSAISKAMATGDIVIIVDKVAAAPASKQQAEPTNDIGNREAGLGDKASKTAVVTEEAKPPCTLDWVSIECSHGRNTGITTKTEITPSLDVISTETYKKGFELITAEIHASELCSSHKNSSFKISKEHKLKSKSNKKIEFNVCCDSWNMSNIFDRVWLPSITPKTYNISVKDTCEAPNIKVNDADINVYPDISWNWRTSINFGQLEFVPGKAKFEYSKFSIGEDSNVILTYNNKETDAKEKYENYIKKPLEGFQKICDTISMVFEFINDPKSALRRIGTQTKNPKPADGKDNTDGNETRLIIQWPKLDINYDSKLVENKQSIFVDHDYSLRIKADPLLDIDIQVDVLDSMIKAAPYPVDELLLYAKERVEEDIDEEQDIGIRGELDIIFTAKSTVNINESEIKGRHNVIEHDKEVKPIKGDITIPAKLEGAIKAEGKWFVISFTVHYTMAGETEWSGDFEFGNDEKGIYFSNSVEFKGIDVTLTKYEELKAELEIDKNKTDRRYDKFGIEIESEDTSTSISMEDGEIKGKATKKTKEDKRWSWLKPKEDKEKQAPKKHYIIEH